MIIREEGIQRERYAGGGDGERQKEREGEEGENNYMHRLCNSVIYVLEFCDNFIFSTLHTEAGKK